MHKRNLVAITALLIGAFQANAAQDNKDEKKITEAQRRLLPTPQEISLMDRKKLEPVSDEKLVKRELKNVRAFVASFLSMPNGRLSWDVGECYADHLLSLALLYRDAKEGKATDVSTKLAHLERDREKDLSTVPLARYPKPLIYGQEDSFQVLSMQQVLQDTLNQQTIGTSLPIPLSDTDQAVDPAPLADTAISVH